MFLSHALRFNLRGGSFDLFRFMLGPLISRVVFRPPTQARPCHTTLSRHMEAQSEAPYCQRQEANFSPLHKSSSGFCPSLVSLAWCDSVSVVSPWNIGIRTNNLDTLDLMGTHFWSSICCYNFNKYIKQGNHKILYIILLLLYTHI